MWNQHISKIYAVEKYIYNEIYMFWGQNRTILRMRECNTLLPREATDPSEELLSEMRFLDVQFPGCKGALDGLLGLEAWQGTCSKTHQGSLRLLGLTKANQEHFFCAIGLETFGSPWRGQPSRWTTCRGLFSGAPERCNNFDPKKVY